MTPRPRDYLHPIAEDCVWTVGGTSAVAGEYRGRKAVAAFFARLERLTGGTYEVEPVWELADGERGVFLYRSRGARPDGRALDLDQALVYRLEGGRWIDVRLLPFDQGVFDAFWS